MDRPATHRAAAHPPPRAPSAHPHPRAPRARTGRAAKWRFGLLLSATLLFIVHGTLQMLAPAAPTAPEAGAAIHASALPSAGDLLLLRDPSGKLDLAAALDDVSSWQPVSSVQPAAGARTGAVWLHWSLPRVSAPASARGDPPIVELAGHRANLIEVWVLDRNGRVIATHRAGNTLPRAATDRSGARVAFGLPGGREPAATVVARASGPGPVRFAPRLQTASEHARAGAKRDAATLASVGACASLALLGLLVFLSLRERSFLALAAWPLAIGALVLDEAGVGFAWLWPTAPGFNAFAPAMFNALVAASMALVSLTALDGRTPLPGPLRQGLHTVWMASLAVAATVTMVPAHWSLQASWALLASCGLLTVWAAGTRIWHGDRFGTAWIAALLPLQLALLAIVLADHGLAPLRWQSEDLLMAAGLLTAIASMAAGVARLYSPDTLQRLVRSHLVDNREEAASLVERSVSARTFELEAANAHLARASRIDGLTGVRNRRAYDEGYAAAMMDGNRLKRQVAVLMIDLDHFKRLNDEHGHAAGDECLIEAARLAEACIPEAEGFVARYGGEEFVALLHDTNESRASGLAESIRRRIEQAEVAHNDTRLRMTASLGVWCGVPPGGASRQAPQEAADAALYEAKRNGRNRVVTAGDQHEAPRPAHAATVSGATD